MGTAIPPMATAGETAKAAMSAANVAISARPLLPVRAAARGVPAFDNGAELENSLRPASIMVSSPSASGAANFPRAYLISESTRWREAVGAESTRWLGMVGAESTRWLGMVGAESTQWPGAVGAAPTVFW